MGKILHTLFHFGKHDMKILTTLSTHLQGIASIRSFLFLTMIMFGLGYAMLSSASPSEELMALANGLNVPDTQFWRSTDALYSQLADYGEYGIHLYLTRISPVDLFIPIAQALFLAIPITLVFQRAFDANSVWQLLNTIPFAAMAGDYLENASIATIMLIYPNRLDALASISALFTAVKFIASFASIGLIVAGFIVWLVKRNTSK